MALDYNLLTPLAGGTHSQANAITPDGTRIVGWSDGTGFTSHACYWDQSGSGYGDPVDIGTLGGGDNSVAHGISSDGATIVGQSNATAPGSFAFLWTISGMVQLASNGGLIAAENAIATCCSSNGGIIAGGALGTGTGNQQACYWTSGGTVINPLPALGGSVDADTVSEVTACSQNGLIFVGVWTSDLGGNVYAVSWSGAGFPASDLGNDGGTVAQANAVSADGQTIAGFVLDGGGVSFPFICTLGGSLSSLGLPSGAANAVGNAISSDASTIGGSFTGGSEGAFTWTSGGGFVEEFGISVDSIQGLSEDGSIPVGYVNSQFAAWWGSLTPPTDIATVADLWFGQTSGFVDLTSVANRRKFFSVTGGAQNLGTTGQNPFGVTPPVFLTRNGPAATFAANNGRGGSFIVSGGTLDVGATNPPGSTTTTTVVQPNSPGQGVLGDYRNGNLYAFNPATLLDNGTQRRWLRRWRALAATTVQAVQFAWLNVLAQSGAGVPDGTNPQAVLRWSDDGGHSFSDERIVPVGRLGQTRFTIKFNRLGMTRRFSGSDRIFELSSTDPFVVAILDAEVDVK